MRRSLTAALAAAAIWSSPCAAADPEAQSAVALAMQAMGRGYGSMCSLEAVPVASGGYWRCLDVGPYRFVAEYGKVRVFVTGKDMAPFPIMESIDGVAGYTVSGPWSQDLPRRTRAWWSDEFEGGRQRREAGEADGSRRSKAEGAIRSIMEAENPPRAPQPAPETERQAETLPPGAVRLAPGIVRLPDGPAAAPRR